MRYYAPLWRKNHKRFRTTPSWIRRFTLSGPVGLLCLIAAIYNAVVIGDSTRPVGVLAILWAIVAVFKMRHNSLKVQIA